MWPSSLSMWRTCKPKCWTFLWLIELYLEIFQNPIWIINKFKVLIISNQLFGLIVVLLLKLGSYIWRIQHYLTILQDGTMLSYLGLLLNLYLLHFFLTLFQTEVGVHFSKRTFPAWFIIIIIHLILYAYSRFFPCQTNCVFDFFLA